MAEAENTGNTKHPAPPYTSWLTLKNLIAGMKEHGLPGQIDRSVLSNMSGAVQGQVLTALKFLGLIGLHDNAPRTPFRQLVDAYGTDQWQSTLAGVLKSAYAPLFELELQSASPNQFNDKFRASFSADGDTLRKCITFFLNAAREAEIPISAYILRNKKPRTVAAKRRNSTGRPKPSKLEVGEEIDDELEDEREPLRQAKTSFQVLMEDIYDPAEMGPEEEKAVFVLARFLKVREGQP